MAGIRYFALLALAALASGQTIDSLDPCGKDCYTRVLNNAGTYSCAAMDMNCLCRAQDWAPAIRGCVRDVCPPGYDATVANAVAALCATATLPAGVPTSTSQTTSQPAPTTTAAPASSTSESSSQVASTTTSASSGTAVETSTTSAAAASTSTTTSVTAPNKVVASSTSAPAASAASTSEAPADKGAASGLPEAAKIGIGVGVGAAIIGLLTVAACVFLRRRRARKTGPTGMDRYKISGPMPSTEHAYIHNNNSEYDIGSGELEMKSRRYEEMMAGEQPRQMV